MRIVFWENIVSQHKLPYWNALSASNEVRKLVLIVEQVLYQKLKAQGWESPIKETESFELYINPSIEQIDLLLQEDMPNSYHIFSGIKAIPMVYQAFQQSLNYPLHKILLTETVNVNGFRAITRRLASFLIERRYQNHYDMVLGSGASTASWYLECGVKPERFYSFLYSIEAIEPQTAPIAPSENLKFLFIGQLIKRKGLDILLQALAKVKHTNWTLDVYGEGEEKASLLNLIQTHQLQDRVTLKGVRSNMELRADMREYQVLILPSRFDGWGAVINEAIASGLKVICSNTCGASILLINDKIGHVFDSHKPKELTTILEKTILEKDQINRAYILKYSSYLSGEAVAQYFLALLKFHYKNEGSKPLPPWEKFQLENKSL